MDAFFLVSSKIQVQQEGKSHTSELDKCNGTRVSPVAQW